MRFISTSKFAGEKSVLPECARRGTLDQRCPGRTERSRMAGGDAFVADITLQTAATRLPRAFAGQDGCHRPGRGDNRCHDAIGRGEQGRWWATARNRPKKCCSDAIRMSQTAPRCRNAYDDMYLLEVLIGSRTGRRIGKPVRFRRCPRNGSRTEMRRESTGRDAWEGVAESARTVLEPGNQPRDIEID